MPALYIHIPFCAHACPYCDFSFELLRGHQVERFLDAVTVEIEHRGGQTPWRDMVFDTVFFGGGTPTCLTSDQIIRLFTRIRDSLAVVETAEITVEANPETLTDAKLAVLADIGVNRLSLGVQAFTPESLHRLGRHHSVERAIRAVYQARAAGIKHLNLDLMFGAPEQTMTDWEASLTCALALEPDHMSAYGLTIEDGTPFGRLWKAGALALPDEETHIALYLRAIDRLTHQGYGHYEISNFARPGEECRHNLTYWMGGAYLGLGPSAHSHIEGRRFANTRRLDVYLEKMTAQGEATEQDERLTPAQEISEQIMLGIRMIEGLDMQAFESKFGPEAYRTRLPAVTRLTAAGFLEQKGRRLRLTRKGLVVADTVCAELM